MTRVRPSVRPSRAELCPGCDACPAPLGAQTERIEPPSQRTWLPVT